MFGSIKDFFTDLFVPVGLTLATGSPIPAAMYMGIKTGVETGSPLAGIGSAAFSYGIGSLMRPITSAASQGLGGLFGSAAAGASDVGQTIMGESVKSGLESGIVNTATGEIVSSSLNPATLASGPAISSGFANVGPNVIQRTVTPTSGLGFFGGIKDSLSGLIDTSPVALDPSGLITDKAVNPAYIAAGGLGLQMAATPPPAPAPLTMQPPAERDFSKYDYKGPLERGEYTYPDPEDLAYGRVSPDSYGYIGAKAGGQIKKFQMGGFSPLDPRMKPVDSRASTQNVNIMSPPGGIADPSPSANFLATGKIDSVPPGISKLLKAGKAKTKTPKGSPLQTMKQAEKMQKPPKTGFGPMPMPAPQTPAGLPDIMKNIGVLEKRLGVTPTMPRKDLNVSLGQFRSFLGLAEGGDVPGMAEQPPAGSAGSSSGLGVYSTMPNMTEQQFVDSFLSIMPNNLVGNVVRELGMGENIGKQMYAQYKDTKNMAVGGEVESNKELQENAFVIPADVVGHLGDGSSGAGAQKLQSFFGMNPQQYQAGGIMAGELQGPGGGMDDLIQTSIEGKQAAAVSPQEFVVPRDVVAKLGKGSYDQGSKKLYSLMKNVRKVKTGTTKQPNELTLGLNQLMSA